MKYEEIEKLGYDSVYLEKPVADLIDFNWRNILKAPPSNTSKQTITEINYIYNVVTKRTKEDIKLVNLIDQDPDAPFIDLVKEYKLKYPIEIIESFYSLIEPVLFNIKGIWNRPRPAQLAKFYNIDIDVIVTNTHHTAAYPSGHTVYSSLVSLVLKELYGNIDNRKLSILVQNTAKARILQGVHYPSDNMASVVLSQFLFNNLKEKIL
jgi:hypothetical protein